jgi:hypothetical protein
MVKGECLHRITGICGTDKEVKADVDTIPDDEVVVKLQFEEFIDQFLYNIMRIRLIF